MLTTAIQVSVKIDTTAYLGINQMAYTCYGDDSDKNIYYVVPETPVFAEQNNHPNFMFYEYRSEDQNGGYTQFTVMLPQPTEEIKALIRSGIKPGLTDQLKAKSALIVAYVKAYQAVEKNPKDEAKIKARNSALINTGMNEQELSKYITLYQPNKGDDQFVANLLPDDMSKVQLKNPDYTSASASATLILDSNEAFYRQIPTPLHPSNLGDNNTVFSLSLTKEGAELFSNVLKGSDSNASVGIRFDFGLNASLPAAKVVVKYDKTATKEVSQKITHHTWSANEKKITRKFEESGAVTVDVHTELNPTQMGMTQDQYNTWKQGLTDWGQKQVEQILSSQTGLDMSLDLLNDADGYKKFTESLESTSSFTRAYEENSVVAFTISPQNQLPSIQSIVGQDKLPDYFKKYDLDDPFFKSIQPEFRVTNDFEKFNISSIVITANYGTESSTLVFDANKTEPQKTDKWFIDPELGRNYSYSYVVNFVGSQAKAYKSGTIESMDLAPAINVAQCGIVYADISTLISDSAWEKYDQVVVKAQYSDTTNHIAEKQESQVLNLTNKTTNYLYPIGMEQESPLYYSAEYFAKSGGSFTYIPSGDSSPQMPDYGATRSQQIQLVDALPQNKQYTVIFSNASEDKVQAIVFNMTIEYDKYNFSESQNITLTTDFSIPKTLSYNLLPQSEDKSMKVTPTATVVYKDGQTETLTGTVSGGSIVIVDCTEKTAAGAEG